MENTTTQQHNTTAYQFLAGGGEMSQLIRDYDWSTTPLGPIEHWPQSLKTCIRIMLTSRQPFWIGWDKELIKFYNDPYKAILGGKHPWALGKPVSAVWSDIWQDIDPMLKQVMEEDKGTYAESQLLIMERNGYPEETYYTFSYTPIPGDNGGTEGIICANTDDTDKIISERQLKTLTELGKNLVDARSNDQIITSMINTLKENPYDFPFALYYTMSGNKAVFSYATDFGDLKDKIPKEIDLSADNEFADLLNEAILKSSPQVLDKVTEKVGPMPTGAWKVSADRSMILPVVKAGVREPYGFLVFGLNPYRLLDEKYLSFYSLIADQVATSFASVNALDEERKRAVALSEIDKAKTAFFSNISHEFRTPLTLLLGPIEDSLNDEATIPSNRLRMDVAHRNALRMQKLVNTLLEFSRIEAGRLEGKFQPVPICTYTEDLASSFRSAIEKAGMQLIFTCDDIREPVYVDTDMWEKIVLNLISNAFKYSDDGTITVSVQKQKRNLELSVSDTGTGIPEDQLDKIFDRFHRVENSGGRSQEGTGIGLALVKELVKLHGGNIDVKSKVGEGSTFIVSIPIGKSHLPADKVIEADNRTLPHHNSAAYVAEAMKWLPEEEEHEIKADITSNKQRVLLADDNADMRSYVQRLLSDDFEVILATNGEEAMEKALLTRPDLILSDIMMPKVDGFELLNQVRSNAELNKTPFIFLSARAGEEAKVDGLNAGADDYLVKPFSAKELLVRVSNHIKINQVRRETEQKFYQLFLQAPALINIYKGPEHVIELFHPSNKAFVGGRDLTGLKIREALPELKGQGYFELLDEVYRTGETVLQNEMLMLLADEKGNLVEHYLNFVYQPWRNEKNEVIGILNLATDVTDSVVAKLKIQESEKRFRNLVRDASVGIIVLLGKDYKVDIVNDAYGRILERKSHELVDKDLFDIIPEAAASFRPMLDKVRETGEALYLNEYPYLLYPNGQKKEGFVNFVYQPYRNEFGVIMGIMALVQDVTDVVTARRKIEESETKFRTLSEALPQLVWMTDAKGNQEYASSRWEEYTGVKPTGPETWAKIIHPQDGIRMAEEWRKSLAFGEDYKSEVRLKSKEGKYRWFYTQRAPILNDAGEITRWIGAFTDIDDQKNIEERLESLVAERTTALGRSNEDLQQFAHVASHDLKEPTRKIKLFIDRITDDKDTVLSEKSKGFIEKVRNATDRMFSMIDGVLNYSTLNAAEHTIQQVDLNQIMQDIIIDLEVVFVRKNATLDYSGLPVIEGASILIYQLFYNLVANSLKFSRQGVPVVINISSFLIDKDGVPFAEIRLQDNGIGFEEQEASRIFNTFARLNSKDKYEGTGLGLALCKKIAERHGGTISAHGEKNEGSLFIITLPLKQSQNHI